MTKLLTQALAALTVLLALLVLPPQAKAQQTAKVVSSCGSVTYTPGSTNYITVDVNGYQCGSGSGAPASTVVITGTLPAFAAPPTVNQGTAGSSPWLFALPTGASTSALQSMINTTLGAPFQAGGSIGNTGFAINGTLPAFASPPIFQENGLGYSASGKTTVTFSLTSTGTTSSFTPLAGRGFHFSLPTGTGTGSLQLQRQLDGTNWVNYTINGTNFYNPNYTGAPISEDIIEPQTGVPYRLSVTVTSGTVAGSFTQ